MKKKVIYAGKQISYTIEGNGYPVILLHGFGEDSTIFQQQINFLKEHCLLLVPDLPGSGYSAFNPSLQNIEDYAYAIKALLDAEQITQCKMLGHSMGGYIMLAFAEKFPEKLSALGLLHSTAYADTPEKKEVRKRGIELIEAYGAHAFLKNTIPNLFSARYKETNFTEVASLIEKGSDFSKEALQQYYTIMMNRPNRSVVLKNNPRPVLFIMGTEDAAVPIQDVLQQTCLPDCSYVHILQNIGHMGMLEATDMFNQYLLAFVKQ